MIHLVPKPRRPGGTVSSHLAPFSFYGPTCDGMDHMEGPFMLPEDIGEGDHIEIGQTGAYGCTMRTHFNGFHSDAAAILTDAPMLSMYRPPADASPVSGQDFAEILQLRGVHYDGKTQAR